MKLKTLREIDGYHIEYFEQTLEDHNYDNTHGTNFATLKQEAINWIKEFQKERTDAISDMFNNVDKHGIYPTTKFFNRIDDFWKNKFNITEEDLN